MTTWRSHVESNRSKVSEKPGRPNTSSVAWVPPPTPPSLPPTLVLHPSLPPLESLPPSLPPSLRVPLPQSGTYCVGGESLRQRRSWESWQRRVPCSAFLLVDSGGEWSFENEGSWAIGAGRFSRDNSRRRLSKIIEWLKVNLKQAGEGARGDFKNEAYVCLLKFRKQMVLSYRSCRIRTQELEEEALRNDYTTGEGAGLQSPELIRWPAQRRFENKRYEVRNEDSKTNGMKWLAWPN